MLGDQLHSAVLLGLALSVMVGPVFFVLLETAATRGFRAAIVLDTGVILADIVFIAVAYFSSYKLVSELRNAPGLYVFGGTILGIYGLLLLLKPEIRAYDGRIKTKSSDYLGLFIKGFLLNFINVGVLGFWLGIIVVVGPILKHNTVSLFYFFLAVIGTYLAVDVIKILLAKQLRTKLTYNRIVWIKRGLGIVLVISGLLLMLRGLTPAEDLLPGPNWYK